MQGRAPAGLWRIPVKLSALMMSNATWSRSGYGTQSRQLLTRMAKDGHAVAVSANYGIEGMPIEWEGIAHFPRGGNMYNNDVLPAYFQDWSFRNSDKTPILMTLYDVWVLDSRIYDTATTVSWVPVDASPAPVGVAAFLRKPKVRPIAMSRFGEQQLLDAGIACTYIPHAIDTAVFKRTETVDIATQGPMSGRQIIGVGPDRFVVGCFNANQDLAPSRKAWPEILLAFSVFARTHPDAVIYLHTERHGANGGLKMDDLIQAVGIPDHQVTFVNQYAYRQGIPQEGIAALMSGCDVGLAPSYGEGFGLTVLEMQACGVRVIANNASSQPELVGDGWLTDNQPYWVPHQQAWWKAPSVLSIVDCLEQAYDGPRGHSDKARAHAVGYDADIVYRQKWRPLFAELGE